MKKYDSLHIMYISVASAVMLVVLISVVTIIFKSRRKIKGTLCKFTFHFAVLNVKFGLKFSQASTAIPS